MRFTASRSRAGQLRWLVLAYWSTIVVQLPASSALYASTTRRSRTVCSHTSRLNDNVFRTRLAHRCRKVIPLTSDTLALGAGTLPRRGQDLAIDAIVVGIKVTAFAIISRQRCPELAARRRSALLDGQPTTRVLDHSTAPQCHTTCPLWPTYDHCSSISISGRIRVGSIVAPMGRWTFFHSHRVIVGRVTPVTRAMPRCETCSQCNFSTNSR